MKTSKYYLTKEADSLVIWGLGRTKRESIQDGKNEVVTYQWLKHDYNPILETIECTEKLYKSVFNKGWSNQRYIVVDGVAGYKSEFKVK